MRGPVPDDALRDEPEDGVEPVLAVGLTVGATRETASEVVNDRTRYLRTMSNATAPCFEWFA